MKSLKVRLELNHKQSTLARKHAGTARFAYNWGLQLSQQKLALREKRPTPIDLHKLWVKEVKARHLWTYEVSKCSPQQAFRNLDEAFTRVFKVKGAGSPKFKKKGHRDSFYLEGKILLAGQKIKVPKFGWLKTAEDLPAGEVKNCVISRHAEHWFISFKVTHNPLQTQKKRDKIGVDLGLKTLATMSDGQEVASVRAYRKYQRKLKRAQRKVSKRFRQGAKKQSHNYHKAKKKVASIHYRIGCVRRDALHKLTSYLAQNHSQIIIEDLHVRGMAKNHRLASAILDGGFYEFRRQLTYKAAWYGSELVAANRFYPSSKKCSRCGKVKEKLSLRERVYRCEECGLELNRDLNAAINLENYAPRVTREVPVECRTNHKPESLRDTVKQEVNSKTVNVQICVGLM